MFEVLKISEIMGSSKNTHQRCSKFMQQVLVVRRSNVVIWVVFILLFLGIAACSMETVGLLQTLSKNEGHEGRVDSVAFSPSGRILVSASADETVRFWDVQTGSLQRVLKVGGCFITSVAFSPNGKILAGGGGTSRTIRFWDAQTGGLQKQLEVHKFPETTPVTTIVFSSDGRTLAVGSLDGVRFCDMRSSQFDPASRGFGGWAKSIAFSPDGKALAVGTVGRGVTLWNLQIHKFERTLSVEKDTVNSVAFSPDSKILATGSANRAVRLWDVQTGELKRTLTGHRGEVRSVTFSPDGKILATGSADRTVRLWDVQTGKLEQTLAGHRGEVRSIAFSPDGGILASGSADCMVKLWRIE
jgi:WD40 repeat protein